MYFSILCGTFVFECRAIKIVYVKVLNLTEANDSCTI